MDMKVIIVGITVGLIFCIPVIILVSNGNIVISKSYHSQYQEAKLMYEECLESKTPLCPSCECKMGSGGLVWTIIGAIFGLLGYGTFFYYNSGLSKIMKRKVPKKKAY